ncbi:MAG: transporter, partial [Jatrophihabitantaceae bacterium]|nr:transporter [Jatrophihabitantaceae bacterium]
VVRLGGGRVGPELLVPVEALLSQASARRTLSPDRTVVALAGGTGSGKSSLFNAIAGEELAPVTVRRPTTSRARAAIWPAGTEGAGDPSGLLQWLDIRDRHVLDPRATRTDLAGLVLVDLPDFDSTAAAHRAEAERLAEIVDVLVWVLDPQKYADAAVHQRYLRPLAAHREVMLVALNQADRLDRDALEACLRDLGSLLSADGLPGVPLLATSATQPGGADRLVDALSDRVTTQRAAVDRLHADIDTVLVALGPPCSGPPSPRPKRRAGDGQEALIRGLGTAAGVEPIAAAAGASYRMRAIATVGWPLVRWVGRLRPDPLRRLHLGAGQGGPTSRPTAAGAQRAQVSNAVRDLVAQSASGLAPMWGAAAAATLESRQPTLIDELDRSVRSAQLSQDDRPAWWGGVQGAQFLFLVAATAGLAWLAVIAGFAYLQLPGPSVHLGRAPVPTLLFLGGLAAGLLTSVVSRPFVNLGAARRRARAQRSLDAGIRALAQREVLGPLADELAAASAFCAAVDSARR